METVHQSLKAQLRQSGLRATTSRVAVLKILQSSAKPMDVQSILDAFTGNTAPDQATIYRMLESFAAANLVRRVRFDTGAAWYEISSLEDHHHAICTNCNRIEDITGCPARRLETAALRQSGFASIDHHSFEFFGLCKQCARQ